MTQVWEVFIFYKREPSVAADGSRGSYENMKKFIINRFRF